MTNNLVIDLFAYASTLWILVTYFLMNKTGNRTQYNISNAIGWVPILASSVLHQAWPSAFITFSFGMIGIYGLLDKKNN